MKQHFLTPIETALNFALRLDQGSQEKLIALQDYVFEVRFTSPRFSVFMTVVESAGEIKMVLKNEVEQIADVTISGTAFGFFNLAQQGMGVSAMSRNAIKIEGDIEAGQRLQRIMQQLDLDWEGLIARHFGDFAARKMGVMVRDFMSWAKQTNQYTQENMVDYFTHERSVLLSQDEFDIMREELDQVRAQLERLEARAQRLSQRV